MKGRLNSFLILCSWFLIIIILCFPLTGVAALDINQFTSDILDGADFTLVLTYTADGQSNFRGQTRVTIPHEGYEGEIKSVRFRFLSLDGSQLEFDTKYYLLKTVSSSLCLSCGFVGHFSPVHLHSFLSLPLSLSLFPSVRHLLSCCLPRCLQFGSYQITFTLGVVNTEAEGFWDFDSDDDGLFIMLNEVEEDPYNSKAIPSQSCLVMVH